MVKGRAGLHCDGARLERGRTPFFEDTGLSELKGKDSMDAAGKLRIHDTTSR